MVHVSIAEYVETPILWYFTITCMQGVNLKIQSVRCLCFSPLCTHAKTASGAVVQEPPLQVMLNQYEGSCDRTPV